MILPHERVETGPAAIRAAALQAHIPVLDTDRLHLRAPRMEDFQTYAEIAEGPLARFILDEPSREDGWFDFANMTAAWMLRGYGMWTVETKSGDVVGFVLLGFEPGDHEPELGYIFHHRGHGQGFATEAAQAARDFAFSSLGWTTLVSTIDPDNAASINVAKRLNATRDAAAEAAHNNQIVVYRHTAPTEVPQ